MKANLNWDIDNNGRSVTKVICPVCKKMVSARLEIASFRHAIEAIHCPECDLELLAWHRDSDEVMVKRNGEWQPVADEVEA
ncbi:MAG TPA: hypothetical protein VLG74_02845 [Blastocatellia bacterium]|nr:hypothetical protein [Blastocatellia bacterium]